MKDRETMPADSESDLRKIRPRSKGRDGVGPIALLMPVAFALLTFAFLRERLAPKNEGQRAVPPSATRHQEVAGWSGELATAAASVTVELPGTRPGTGARLVASLRPLQSLAERQSFDAAVLRKRFGFADGEPWRLELRYREPRENEMLQPLAIRDFSEITVFDDLGPALAPLAVEESELAATDPLRVLCSAPEVPLRPGYELTLFLWGRRPEGSLRLEGLAGGPFEETKSMTLIPRSLPAQPLHESLAKLERVEKR